MDAGNILTTYGSLWSPAVFAALLALAVGLAWMALAPATQAKRVDERLSGYLDRTNTLGDTDVQGGLFRRVFGPLLAGLIHRLGRFAPRRSMEATRLQLLRAGEPLGLNPIDWYGVRLLVSLAVAVVTFLVVMPQYGLARALTYAALAGLIGFLLTALWLRSAISRRKHQIQRALPDALDMLTIGVEAGLAFEAALLRVGEKWDNPLTRALTRALGEMRVGTPRDEALRRMAERCGVPDLNTFVAVLIQSSQLGMSIAHVLHAQAAEVRLKRRMRVEELARQAGVKMIFPLVLFILPVLFIIGIGPAIPRIARVLGGIQVGGLP